jgi:hypothetical protein
MPSQSSKLVRVFQTAWFAKAASKGRISEQELCIAIGQVMLGQADDLGGGVFKKRLNKNRDRSIILAKGVPSGSMNIYSQRKIGPTSTQRNWPNFAESRKSMHRFRKRW